MVGENGPELINIPKGSSVTSNADTNAMFSRQSRESLSRQEMLISVTHDGLTGLRKDVKELKSEMETMTRKITGMTRH